MSVVYKHSVIFRFVLF